MSGNSSLSDCSHISLVAVNTTLAYLLFLMFPAALLLNVTAAWVSLELQTSSAFIVYFKNLIAADLLVTLTAPLMAANLLPDASLYLQMFACRFSDVLLYSGLYTGICLMGMMSLDRFFKIVRPRGMAFGQSVLFSTVSSTFIWVSIFVGTALPTMILTDRHPSDRTEDLCMSMKGPAGQFLHKIVISVMESVFWLVTFLMVFCYVCITLKVLQSFRNSGSRNTHGKKRTKLRVFLILTVYFVCFAPLHLMRIPYVLNTKELDGCVHVLLEALHRSVLWLSITNVCLDPLLYVVLCREFKEKLMKKIHPIGFCVFGSE
ncbi:P2Y purinoceptor 13-like [Neosynchiropus ocellatus]